MVVKIVCAVMVFSAALSAETVGLYFDAATPQIAFAAGDIKAALEKRAHTVETHDLAALADALRTTNTPDRSYWVLGGDANGAMYGGLEMAENINYRDFAGTYDSQQSLHIVNRGVKANLPLDKRPPILA